MPDIDTIRVVLPEPQVVRISVTEAPTVSIVTFRDLPSSTFVQKQTDFPTPETENDIIACLQAAGLCALIFLSFILPANAADFGDIPRSLAMPAGQSVRRNAGNTAFEAFSPSSYTFIDSILNTGGSISLVNDSATPGNSKYYGTDSGGTRGFFSLPVSGVSSWNGRTGDVLPEQDDYAESQLSFTDITTNDVSTSAHGFQPKLPGDPTLFMNGEGSYVAVLGGQNQGTRLISGGGVAWTGTGLNFIVSAADYIINGVEYTSAQTNLTLTAADPSLDRIDSFYVDVNGVANYITGTPAANPVAPAVDPATQLYLTFAYIQAGATTPVFTNENIYLENTEWTTSQSGGTINLASTNNPYAGTKCIEGTSVATGNLFTAVKPIGTLKPTDYANVVLQIRSKASWPNPKSISIFWMSGASAVGTAATLKQGAFGFDSSNTSSYQQIVIPTATFNTGTTSVDRIRFQIAGGGGNIGWYIDNIILQTGGGGGTGGGGDFSTDTTASVDGEIVLFKGTTGKLGRRSTGTGLLQIVSGVLTSPTPAPLTKVNDTNVTLTLGGSATTALVNSASLTLGWTGTLGLSRGGLATDATSVAAHNYFGNNTGSTGSAGFHQIAASEIASGAALTKSDDTNVTLTLGGSPTTALLAASSITAGWTGTLSQARGGFGKSSASVTDGQIPIGKTSDGSWNFNTITQGSGITVTNGAGTITIANSGVTTATHTVTFTMDGYGSALTARTGSYVKIPYGGTLTGWTLIGSPSGSITIDIVRAADAAGLPVTSIVGGGGTKPALSSAVENKSTSFTGWTSTTLNAFDNLAITTSAITSTTYVCLILYYQ